MFEVLFNINWNAVSAIGTILAAIATFCAVVVALSSNKPRIKIGNMVNAVNRDGKFVSPTRTVDSAWLIIVTNVGMIPVTIKLVGYRAGRSNFLINPDPMLFGSLPNKLNSSDEFTVWTEMIKEKIFIFNPSDLAFAVDTYGNYYYAKVSIMKFIIRKVWWKFGGSYKMNGSSVIKNKS